MSMRKRKNPNYVTLANIDKVKIGATPDDVHCLYLLAKEALLVREMELAANVDAELAIRHEVNALRRGEE